MTSNGIHVSSGARFSGLNRAMLPESQLILAMRLLTLVSGQVRKMGEAKTNLAENPYDAVKKYVLDCLHSRGGVEDRDVEVMVVERKRRALAKFQVLFPNCSHKGFYQASVVIGEGLAQVGFTNPYW